MSGQIINGNEIAREIKEKVKSRVLSHTQQNKRPPQLVVIIVGENPASKIYVAAKEKDCQSVGMKTKSFHLPDYTTQKEVVELIKKLNEDKEVDGILVQLPLPDHINKNEILENIDPLKDVDGLTPFNQGQLAWNRPGLYPCTPLGVMEILNRTEKSLQGQLCAILGRSVLVGASLGVMLTHAGASIIGMHSLTKNPKELTKQADILISATGVHHLVKKDWIKPGAIVIDVGISRRSDGSISGDIFFDDVKNVSSYITPVPGGVGPMTRAMLVSNCLKAYELRTSLNI